MGGGRGDNNEYDNNSYNDRTQRTHLKKFVREKWQGTK